MTTKSVGRGPRRASAADAGDDRSQLDVWSEKLESLFASSQSKGIAAAVIVAGDIVVGLLFGLELAVLSLAAVALLLVIWLMWLSLQSLAGETPITLDEAMGLAAPSAEEERKRSVLRALKDLEYERSVGKISEQDYAELSTRYRDEAKNLMRQLQEGNSQDRAEVERVVTERLVELGLSTATKPKAKAKTKPDPDDAVDDAPHSAPENDSSEPAGPGDEPGSADDAPGGDVDDEEPPTPSEPEPELSRKTDVAEPAKAAPSSTEPDARPRPTRRCSSCSTRNELDAVFCKQCGSRMAGADQVLCRACPCVYSRSETSCPDCGVRQEAE